MSNSNTSKDTVIQIDVSKSNSIQQKYFNFKRKIIRLVSTKYYTNFRNFHFHTYLSYTKIIFLMLKILTIDVFIKLIIYKFSCIHVFAIHFESRVVYICLFTVSFSAVTKIVQVGMFHSEDTDLPRNTIIW